MLRKAAKESGASEAELVRRAVVKVYGEAGVAPASAEDAGKVVGVLGGNQAKAAPAAVGAGGNRPTTGKRGSKHLTAEEYAGLKPSEQLRAMREGRGPAG